MVPALTMGFVRAAEKDNFGIWASAPGKPDWDIIGGMFRKTLSVIVLISEKITWNWLKFCIQIKIV